FHFSQRFVGLDQRAGGDEPGQFVAGVERLFHLALAFDAAVIRVGENGATNLLGIAAFFQDLVADERVFRRRGIFFIVKVVEQPDDGPLFFILAKLAGVGSHAGFHRQHVLAQALRLGKLAHQVPGCFAVHHGFSLVFSFYSLVSSGIIPVLWCI